jgi:hypothetical protein
MPDVHVALFTQVNPNAPARLMAETDIDAWPTNNAFYLYDIGHYIADEVTITGKDNPCEISARIFSVSLVQSLGAVKPVK